MINPTVTLVVPAYNPPKGHFEECCRSINGQLTQFAFEVIVVDDHSDKDSAREISEACGRFGFGLLRNGGNLGVSRSRNEAMSMARGDYIAFLDADDCIYPDFIEDSVRLAEETGADCVIGDLVLTAADDFLPERPAVGSLPNVFRGSDVSLVMAGIVAGSDFMLRRVAEADSFVHAGPVARLYSRDVIMRHDLTFDPALACGEDIKFNLEFLAMADSCVTTEKTWYQYKQHMTSATHGVKPEQLEEQIRFCEDLLENPTIRRFGMEQVAYGRILGGLKTLVFRVCSAGYFGRGEVKGEIARLVDMEVFRIACDSIDLAQFQLAAKDEAFVWLCRMRFSAALYLLTLLALAGKRPKRPWA